MTSRLGEVDCRPVDARTFRRVLAEVAAGGAQAHSARIDSRQMESSAAQFLLA
jgi:hypothetical protein